MIEYNLSDIYVTIFDRRGVCTDGATLPFISSSQESYRFPTKHTLIYCYQAEGRKKEKDKVQKDKDNT